MKIARNRALQAGALFFYTLGLSLAIAIFDDFLIDEVSSFARESNRSKHPTYLSILIAMSVIMASATFGFIRNNLTGQISRAVVLISFAAAVALVPLAAAYLLNLTVSQPSVVASAIGGGLGLFAFAFGSWSSPLHIFSGASLLTFALSANFLSRSLQPEADFVPSTYHDVKKTEVSIGVGDVVMGGAIAYTGGARGLIATGNGTVYRFTADADQTIRLEEAAIQIPLYPDPGLLGDRTMSKPSWVTDVHLVDNDVTSPTLYSTFTIRDESLDCYGLRLTRTIIDDELFSQVSDWETLYDSRPCLSLTSPSIHSGGRLAELDYDSLLFTVGSFNQDSKVIASSDYGKVLKLNHKLGAVSVFTTGHRNAQGLLVASSGIYLTEHGPHGGDELNQIIQGNDYGWPYSSYGNSYGKKYLEQTGRTGDHSLGSGPIYAWLPSIGISSLIEVRGNLFNMWYGDLLIGSLVGRGFGRSLYRVRIRDDRAVSVERIPLGRSVRDLVELADGRVLIWDGYDVVQILEPADDILEPCRACHGISYNHHGIGPDLHNIVGAKVARFDNFQYSNAMGKFGGRWSREILDKFIENPQSIVPGTTMEFDGISDPSQRTNIIDYLEGVSTRP